MPSEQHVGTALASAAQVRGALEGERWELLGIAIGRANAGERGFVEVVAALRDAAAADEFAVKLAPAVAKAYGDAVKLIGSAAPGSVARARRPRASPRRPPRRSLVRLGAVARRRPIRRHSRLSVGACGARGTHTTAPRRSHVGAVVPGRASRCGSAGPDRQA